MASGLRDTEVLADRRNAWLTSLRRYMALIVLANLAWEIAQLPLYTIWRKGSPGDIAFAVVHCTTGDVLIASSALLGALLVLGDVRWPHERYGAVATFTLVAGLAYTAFSEWLNVTVRGSWAYTELMPTIPMIGIGLSPLAQWIAIPLAAFWLAHRPATVQTQLIEKQP